MSDISDIVARPLLPIEAIWALGALALLLAVLGLRRRLKGAWLRIGAAAALLAALLDPALVSEDREPLSDIAVIVVDESASQTIEDRAETARAAREALLAQLRAENEGEPVPLEIRVVAAPGDPEDGTRLLTVLAEATEDIARDRFAGAVLITDGAVVDADLGPPLAALASEESGGESDAAVAPVHVLVTGRPDEYDRRLVIEATPSFGIVDEAATLRYRVSDDGDAPELARAPALEVYVDGELYRREAPRVGALTDLDIPITHAGRTVVELRLAAVPGELTTRNNVAAFSINGVRDRLKVLLVSGEPHPGERTWRNLLKADPSVELVHFTILKPPEKDDGAPPNELALIEFPTYQLFEETLDSFHLIIFDRFQDRPRVLRSRYIENIANFVSERGRAVLVSTGPAFAGPQSMAWTPLGGVLPATPTGRVVEGAFRPSPTVLGDRHPVTRALEGRGAPGAGPEWGRWFRRLEVEARSGDILMEAPEGGPLIILDRVGDGRVALIASDHTWLWARGYDGGGPQAELLRRTVHWLMKEPELEEDALTAEPAPGGFLVTRRSLIEGDKTVVMTPPRDAETVEPAADASAPRPNAPGDEIEIALEEIEPGVWTAFVATEALGVHRLTDAPQSAISEPGEERTPLSAVAVVGPPSPEEFARPVSTTERLAPVAAATGGAVIRLSDVATPELRRTRSGRAAAGSDWVGLARREAYDVRGVTLAGIAPSWLLFGLAALLSVAAWRVEGR